MNNFKSFWGGVGFIAATTIGAGMFSLPYIFHKSGWLTGIFYLIVLSGAVIFVHRLYWLSLERANGGSRLLGLVREHLGKCAFYASTVSVVAGLFLILLIYLILSESFARLILPSATASYGAILFWLAASLPLLLKLPRIVGAEFFGTVLMFLIVFFIFLTGQSGFSGVSAVNLDNVFLPFGAILFSLTGWTVIEPMFRWEKKNGDSNYMPKLVFGTLLSAIIYLLFVAGILGSADSISPDALSGLSSWPSWKIQLLGWLGIFAMWTSYVPISLEIKNELKEDLHLPPFFSYLAVIFLPLLLFFSGFFNFLGAISLAGGVFLALQYIFIILVSKKILALSSITKFFANLLILVFLAAAVYSVAHYFQ
ncbi:MAG: aromatic amino acid transport family protein [Patescibacteria group bacterium]|mgnify:CR=1 FL=1